MQQKGFTALPILAIILIVGGLIGGYWYINRDIPTAQITQSLQPKREILESQFKNYQNDKLGIQLQYSKDLSLQEDFEEQFNKRGNGDFRKNFTSYVAYPPAEMIGGIVVLDETSSYEVNPLTIWVFNNPDNLTIEQFYEKYWYYPFVWGDYTLRRFEVAPVNEVTISGRLAKYGTVTYQPNSPKFNYLPLNGKMYLFRVIGEKGDQILQSVKFLEGVNGGGCKTGGCSDQLCVEESEEGIITTCEFREEYACYKDARCERQEDGKCGWIMSEELVQCLKEKRGSQAEVVF